MAQKRSAKEAFGAPKGQLSAAAAARQAKLLKEQAQQADGDDELAGSIAGVPYNGHHTGSASDEDQDSGTISRKVTIPTIQFSTVDPTSILLDDDDAKSLTFSLKADQTATFIGEYDLEMVKGVVNISGAMIHPELGRQRVYALSTHALPSITARNDSIIRVTSVKSGLRKLAKLSPLFRNIGCAKSSRSFQFLAANTSDSLNRPLVTLEVDEMSKRILSRINAKLDNATPIILAIGPKSSGKSTFNRLLTNMIISRPGPIQKYWYLDLDPGQPEFGPPGQISLIEISTPVLGPPYTHPATSSSKSFRLVRSHTIAATTFKDDAEHYLSCAADLVETAASDRLPMVINSCGWTSGLGASTLLSFILSLAKPPEVILLGESPDSELAQSLPPDTPLHVIPRRTRVQSTRTPAEQRAMSTMSYFHLKKPSSKTGDHGEILWNPTPLSAVRPWLISYNLTVEESGLTAILSYGQFPYPDFLAEILEGAIVAIVTSPPDLINEQNVLRTKEESLPHLSDETTLDPKRTSCLGLALVRGIDVEKKMLQLLTPVDLEGQKVILVRGGFDPADWALLEDLYSGGGNVDISQRPWVELTGDAGGGSVEHGKVWRVRRPPMAGGK